MNVAARQFPVTIHFSRRTEMVDYVSEALRKTPQSTKLPPGDILVFLTGQKEVEDFCKQLRRNYPLKKKKKKKRRKSPHRITTKQGNEDEDEVEDEDYEDDDDEEEVEEGNEDDVIGDAYDVDAADAAGEVLNNFNEDTFQDDFDDDERSDVSEEDEVVVMGDVLTEEETKIAEVDWARKYAPTANLEVTADETVGKKKEEDGNENNDGEDDDGPGPLNVFAFVCHASASKAQARVFAKTPKGYKRNVIVSTNVAETSLTIPGVRYVVDAGRQKERKYEELLECLDSKLDGFQKRQLDSAGRAGRTAPGHCYRLFSSALRERFRRVCRSAITTAPVDGVVLSMRYLRPEQSIEFPFHHTA